ncbi:uncharacterized protein MKZ38_007013 [Zalerion maritima]|uniref:AP-3 complex subunit delta n=1 Tax=Zalerion maritima TaxID=339359 RepID=A0AAD5RV58_9PEZI|nr:uncharacterized protein MKZ38_007013 [Zalerion maritima]
MFEKSLVDLIKGMRNHAGNEKEFMQKCLKECRSEIQSQDMDLKATALLKVIYLEMFGNDMSWASFRVLEVMASPKYHQKRVGYLGAVQSFRPDTEVLMLATNLLKKDLTQSLTSTINLPIAALPHIATSSLALSCLSDLLPRLSHSNPSIRKKTIVTLYRLALVYPETLRAAWPRIKDRLMDQGEDPSVTAAIINVICELGWRRPHDFLPLAPRLFELLVGAHNNWMAIKLIKLFATLTHVEPRLVKKLLPPLTDLIRTTSAMSLLYECINGIIQGGILGSSDDVSGREEIATLCVSKLRGMIMIEGDPNLKYVALLAFNKIVATHPFLVAEQEDVILECIDSRDITIRVKALDLVQGMVSSDNLVSIVSRLMRQLKGSNTRQNLTAGSDDEYDDESQPRSSRGEPDSLPLPEDYRTDVVNRILIMCSQNNFANLLDFDWYIDILTQLARSTHLPNPVDLESNLPILGVKSTPIDVSEKIGDELRNVAVKVRAVRLSTVRAAETILARANADSPLSHPVVSGSLKPVSWILGEYCNQLSSSENILNLFLQLLPRVTSPDILTTGMQSAAKILAVIAGDDMAYWTAERKSQISLMLGRFITILEPLALHPNLEVQERAVQFVELLRLTAEAVSAQAASTDELEQDTPLLLTQAIPSLFNGWELNSVAPGAQHNVPMPTGLDLDEPIHQNLSSLLATASQVNMETDETDDFDNYYHRRPAPTSISSEPAINRLADVSSSEEVTPSSYQQQATEESYLDADIIARRRAERKEKNRDDPFYIAGGSESGSGTGTPGVSVGGTSTPIHNILQNSNGPDLDFDAIPVMQLDLGKLSSSAPSSGQQLRAAHQRKKSRPMSIPKRVVVAADETLASGGGSTPHSEAAYSSDGPKLAIQKSKGKSVLGRGLLHVDSSNIGSLSLEGDTDPGTFEKQQREEAEMAAAVKEVERLRLEMQRASERIQVAEGVEVVSVKSKKKKGASATGGKKKKASATTATIGADGTLGAVAAGGDEGSEVTTKPKKKTKNITAVAGVEEFILAATGGGDETVVAKPKKKKKKVARVADIE